jgi:hypothetical protein
MKSKIKIVKMNDNDNDNENENYVYSRITDAEKYTALDAFIDKVQPLSKSKSKSKFKFKSKSKEDDDQNDNGYVPLYEILQKKRTQKEFDSLSRHKSFLSDNEIKSGYRHIPFRVSMVLQYSINLVYEAKLKPCNIPQRIRLNIYDNKIYNIIKKLENINKSDLAYINQWLKYRRLGSTNHVILFDKHNPYDWIGYINNAGDYIFFEQWERLPLKLSRN